MYSIDITEKWFKDYTDSFRVNGALAPMMQLKLEHSRRVQENASAIAKTFDQREENADWLAHAVGLLHDTARFEQDRDYRTFADSASFDHGDRGAEILEKNFPWEEILSSDREKVLLAVRYHNKIAIPDGIVTSAYKWCALVRDADKIDVFRMVQNHLDDGTIYDMLPRHKDAHGLSPALVDEVRATRRGSYTRAHSLVDFRLIQLTWALDLNYPISVSTLRADGIFRRIFEDLKDYGIDELLRRLMAEIDKM